MPAWQNLLANIVVMELPGFFLIIPSNAALNLLLIMTLNPDPQQINQKFQFISLGSHLELWSFVLQLQPLIQVYSS